MKQMFIGHYGCEEGDRIVSCVVSRERSYKRPHWQAKWAIKICPACGKEHQVVQPMWRKTTRAEWDDAEVRLRAVDQISSGLGRPVVKPGNQKGIYAV